MPSVHSHRLVLDRIEDVEASKRLSSSVSVPLEFETPVMRIIREALGPVPSQDPSLAGRKISRLRAGSEFMRDAFVRALCVAVLIIFSPIILPASLVHRLRHAKREDILDSLRGLARAKVEHPQVTPGGPEGPDADHDAAILVSELLYSLASDESPILRDFLTGGCLCFDDNGLFYESARELPQGRLGRSSHRHAPGEGKRFALPGGAELLMWSNVKTRRTYMQLENATLSGIVGSICHMRDYFVYRLTGWNQGPFGMSALTECRPIPVRVSLEEASSDSEDSPRRMRRPATEEICIV